MALSRREQEALLKATPLFSLTPKVQKQGGNSFIASKDNTIDIPEETRVGEYYFLARDESPPQISTWNDKENLSQHYNSGVGRPSSCCLRE